MYSKSGKAVNAYANVGLETGVLADSTHKLIMMLFQGANVALSSALVHMKNGDVNAKGAAISKAIAIITSGLQASLDVETGGELAQQLNFFVNPLHDATGRCGMIFGDIVMNIPQPALRFSCPVYFRHVLIRCLISSLLMIRPA